MAKGLAGYKVSFASVKDMTLGDVFGVEAIPATQLMKSLWALIKSKSLKVTDAAPIAPEVPYKLEPAIEAPKAPEQAQVEVLPPTPPTPPVEPTDDLLASLDIDTTNEGV